MTEVQNPPQGNEDYEARMKAWESEKKGIVRDLQGERDKRHALEREIEEMKAKLAPPPEEPVANAEVERLAQNPSKYIQEISEKIVSAKISQIERNRQFEKAYQWLAKQEGKDPDEVAGSDLDKELVRISKEHGISMVRPDIEIKALYKIYKQEKNEKELEEKNRETTIQGQANERVTTPARPGTRRWTRQMISEMSDSEYLKYAEEINEAERKGQIL